MVGAPAQVSSQAAHDQKPLAMDKQLRVGVIALFAAIGAILFGLDVGYIGPIIESISFKQDVPHIDANVQMLAATEGLIVSLFSIGAMFTALPLISSYFIDGLGRKPSIIVGGVVFLVGSAIQGFSTTSAHFLIGRFVAGMAIGLLSSVIVLYQSEMAPPNMRGMLSTLYQLGITFGILLAAFIDQLVVDRNEGWRMVMGIISVPAVVLVLGMMVMPRSPRWLVSKGKREEALKVLLTIRNEEDAVREEEEIFHEIEKSKAEGELAWSELFNGRVCRLVVLGVTLQILQQLVGMNAFMYFGPKIFGAIGVSATTFNTISMLTNFLSTFPAVFLADRVGRRSLLLWSSIGMSIACVVMGSLGLVFISGDAESGFECENAAAGYAIAIMIFFFVFNFAFGFGPIVWVYCAEIFPLRVRARCLGVTTLANWAGNFIIAQFTPMLLGSVAFGTFYVFGFFCIASVFLSAWLPETKGVPLENIQKLFDNKAGFMSTAEVGKEAIELAGGSESTAASAEQGPPRLPKLLGSTAGIVAAGEKISKAEMP